LPSAKIPSPNLASAPATAAAPLRFAALGSTNFRLFWIGNAISWVGSLAQQTALGWLVRVLTPDPRVVTLVAACATLPIIFLSLHAGAIADRVDRRRALLGIGVAGGFLAAIIATLILLQVIQVWHVVVFALASGALAAFEIPIRQSFVAELVKTEALPSAIALNSTAFNTARVIGPALGGILISGLGLAGCFYANALSFVAIITGLLLMKLPAHHATQSRLNLLTIWKGILFVRRHETLRLIIMLVAVVSFWAMSFSALLPIFAKDVFHTDERGFSLMMSCNGLGALLAAMTFAAKSEMRHSGKRLLLGAFSFCIATFCFASSANFVVACAFLLVSGFCLVTFAMTANTLVQTLSPNLLRGRIFSLYSLSMLGAIPIGTLVLGALAKWQNARIATQIGTFIASVFVFWMFWKFRSLWKAR
jgi:MFS family permease